ncbi:hypothetical protein JT359_08280 [Candidatus Poribacteria bacterium]|nr:hypothetical protein [Candidatus Poribacteria bacterium]
MKKQHVIYLIIIAFIILVTEYCYANDRIPKLANNQESGKISGKVVDPNGKPMSSFIFVIHSIKEEKSQTVPIGRSSKQIQPIEQKNKDRKQPSTVKVITRKDGSFDVSNVPTGFVQVYVPPESVMESEKLLNSKLTPGKGIPAELILHGISEPDATVVSTKIGNITYFNNVGVSRMAKGITFKLKPLHNYKEVVITVKQHLKLTAKVVYSDGSPLKNSAGSLNIQFRYEENPNSGTGGSEGFTTNAEGVFTKIINKPGFYTLSVKYNSLKGGIGPFLLNDDVQPENLVIQLDGISTDVKPSLIRLFGNKRKAPIAQQKKNIVWTINPTNGHAYALIPCNSWQEAQKTAIKEGAHLVSINSEEEQFWLTTIFPQRFWIGLNDVKEEGKWQWDSGEPATYFNWSTRNMYPDNDSIKEKDYAVCDFYGEWEPVGSDSHLRKMTRHAIIEKDGLVSIPIPQKNNKVND